MSFAPRRIGKIASGAVSARMRRFGPDEMLSNDLIPFLTAFDPAEKGGGSIDPLGFERGYLQLADQILPGLTNVANRPRYFGLLCAGALLARPESDRPRDQAKARLEAVLRLERLWALANVAAAKDADDESLGAIRGVNYARAHLRYLEENGSTRSSVDFRLLSRQSRYGAVGIYGAVADGLGLWDRDTLLPTPEFGDELGQAFLNATDAPAVVQRIARGADDEVSLQTLRTWGARALVGMPPGTAERKVLTIAVEQNGIRRRMAEALARRPARKSEAELARLERIADALGEKDRDLRLAIVLILAYEEAYAAALLAFERLLWASRQEAQVQASSFASDAPFGKATGALRRASGRVAAASTRYFEEVHHDGLDALGPVTAFLTEAAGSANSTALVDCVVRRHSDVQRAKFDRGRPKLPWLEITKGSLRLTFARSTERTQEPKAMADIQPHFYRTAAADALYSEVAA